MSQVQTESVAPGEDVREPVCSFTVELYTKAFPLRLSSFSPQRHTGPLLGVGKTRVELVLSRTLTWVGVLPVSDSEGTQVLLLT